MIKQCNQKAVLNHCLV